MTTQQLAEKIADTEYPISGKSSERLNADMVRKIIPIINQFLKDYESDNSKVFQISFFTFNP